MMPETHLRRRFKNFPPAADAVYVTPTVIPPHQVRPDPWDLEALATVWRWEGVVRRVLPRAIAEGDLEIRFQAVFDVRSNVPVIRGYEAYTRFPQAPRIPTRLWFATAEQIGLGDELVTLVGSQALARLGRLPRASVLFVNATPGTGLTLTDIIPRETAQRVVFDIPGESFRDGRDLEMLELVRSHGVGVAFDEGPVATDTLERLADAGNSLDFVKLDVLAGVDEPSLGEMTRRVSDWCHRRGIFVVAKRAEHVKEIEELRSWGVDWAQGYALARPMPI
jgi:EAL domain-containing protein (putative c-di-GMP-specific phosphodiesterase class I)